ncbi:MAG: polyprenyl synthetase family protein [Myxococcaceae bacterium]|jgi:geranylgeranyl diphosphate synthase type II|nr:polyprenyl synthetase family protein [Myxococcaceae bacterium]
MSTRLEDALNAAVARAEAEAPAKLASALRYAVFPGGARVRPRLSLAVAQACGDRNPALADAAAVALELMHCASLVHDDLPCFDDAPTRRGKPSVHRAFGEPLAVLTGDALIVAAFEGLALAGASAPQRLSPMIVSLSKAVGAPHGIVAGQAWESEPAPPLDRYHAAKTGSLFVAATTLGALASDEDGQRWATLGARLGAAYQVADDLLDAVGSAVTPGKPLGRDESLDRPNAVARLGVQGAIERLERLVDEAIESIPACSGRAALIGLVRHIAERLVPVAIRAA